jgi:hypothetical protein
MTWLCESLFSQNPPSLLWLGAVKFVEIGFYLSIILLWLFLQGLIFLAERYSRLMSNTEWWRSGVIAGVAIMVHFVAWQIPGMFSEQVTVDRLAAMTSALIGGTVVAWILIGKLYQFEFLHRLVVAIGVPVFVICALALGMVLQMKLG